MLRHQFTIKVVTDGRTHVPTAWILLRELLEEVPTSLQIPSIWGLKRRGFFLSILMTNTTFMCIWKMIY